MRGDQERAVALLEEGAALARAQGDNSVASYCLGSLGHLALVRGDYDRALALQRESLIRRRDLKDKLGIALSLAGVAWVASARGRAAHAARLFGAADAIWESMDSTILPQFHAEHDTAVAATRAGLGEEAFANARREGRAMSWERAVAYALEDRPDDA